MNIRSKSKWLCAFLALFLGLQTFALIGCTPKPKPNPNNNEGYKDYPLLNSSFDADLSPETDFEWDRYLYDTVLEKSTDIASNGTASLKVSAPISGYFSMWQVLPIPEADYSEKFDKQFAAMGNLIADNNTTIRFPAKGDEISFSLDMYMPSANEFFDFSLIKIGIKSENARKVPTIFMESGEITLKPDQWVTVTAKAKVNEGRIPEEAVIIVPYINMDLPEDGVVFIDNVKIGSASPAGVYVPPNNEDNVQGYDAFDDRGVFVELNNGDFESTNMTFRYSSTGINAGNSSVDAYFGKKSLKINENSEAYGIFALADSKVSPKTVSAGVWVKLDESSVGEGASVILEAKINNEFVVMAEAKTTIKKRWVYLKTPLPNSMYKDATMSDLRIKLKNNSDKPCLFDFVEVGDWQRINGNKHLNAIMCYQPWFSTPESTQPEAQSTWGNWAFDSSSSGGRNYNPSTIINKTTPYGTQQRDIASVQYPIIGAYDCLDTEVINYQVELIAAMNCDMIQANYYGSMPSARYQKQVCDNLMNACRENGLKFSILYEPKIHLNGWVPHSSRALSIEAISQDIIDFLKKYENDKAMVRYNDLPMVEIFGINLLTGEEWATVKSKCETAMGQRIYLMGDGIGHIDHTNTDSLFQWSLLPSDAINTDHAKALEYCKGLNSRVIDWTLANEFTKMPVAMIYPGFDDTPVRNWNGGNIRKIGNTGPDFFDASWKAYEAYKDQLDWLEIATWNDWTEGTIIEPTRELGHELALITASRLASYKGQKAPSKAELEAITQAYLNTRTINYI